MHFFFSKCGESLAGKKIRAILPANAQPGKTRPASAARALQYRLVGD
jgi:hypothetical protein